MVGLNIWNRSIDIRLALTGLRSSKDKPVKTKKTTADGTEAAGSTNSTSPDQTVRESEETQVRLANLFLFRWLSSIQWQLTRHDGITIEVTHVDGEDDEDQLHKPLRPLAKVAPSPRTIRRFQRTYKKKNDEPDEEKEPEKALFVAS